MTKNDRLKSGDRAAKKGTFEWALVLLKNNYAVTREAYNQKKWVMMVASDEDQSGLQPFLICEKINDEKISRFPFAPDPLSLFADDWQICYREGCP